MKKQVLFVLLLSSAVFVKGQSIIVYATERIKTAEVPVIRTEFNVLLDDSVKKKLTTQADGSLPRIHADNGSHKIVLSSEEYNTVTETNVVVKDFRTTEITIYLSRKSQPKIESKK